MVLSSEISVSNNTAGKKGIMESLRETCMFRAERLDEPSMPSAEVADEPRRRDTLVDVAGRRHPVTEQAVSGQFRSGQAEEGRD